MRTSWLVSVIAAAAASAAFAATPVLRVNDTVLTDGDLAMAKRAVAMQMQGMPSTDAVVTRHAVDQLISKTLVLQAARDAKITADPKVVAASIDEQRSQLGGPEAFAKALAAAGLTEQELVQKETDRLIIQKYLETEMTKRAAVSDADAKAYYDANPKEFAHPEEVKVRMILVKVNPAADPKEEAALKARAEDARKRVTSGEDFAKVASEISDDPSKAKGGEIPTWIQKGRMLPDLEGPVWALKPGEVSQVLRSKYGYHIFKMESRRDAGQTSFAEVEPTLVSFLKNRKVDDAIQGVIQERRAKAKIEALDPAVKAALEPPPAPAAPKSGTAAPGVGPAKPAAPAKPPTDAPKQP
jgi:parvulin-like peptidyl-prolyl isomerase